MKLSEVSEHNKDVTAEQIATRLVRRFEEGQRRSDGSMALHPNHERWYIADAYRLATIILGESNRRGWVCIRHRCAAHYDVPAQNANEASGSECGGCIAAERDALRAENRRLNAIILAGGETLERQRVELAQNHEDWTALRAENAKLRERVGKLERACNLAFVLVTDIRPISHDEPRERSIPCHHEAGIVRKLRTALAACDEEEGS